MVWLDAQLKRGQRQIWDLMNARKIEDGMRIQIQQQLMHGMAQEIMRLSGGAPGDDADAWKRG